VHITPRKGSVEVNVAAKLLFEIFCEQRSALIGSLATAPKLLFEILCEPFQLFENFLTLSNIDPA